MKTFKHKFVEFIPDKLDDDVLYISMQYKSAVHMCACGCRNKVVTPLTPNDWCISYNGSVVSLYPSIGNWSFNCRSHYWLQEGKVNWAENWSQELIDSNRRQDAIKKKVYYDDKGVKHTNAKRAEPTEKRQKKSLIVRILTWDFK